MNYNDRDISWLSFNERIIQEAEDENVSLEDKLKFLAIYSSNLEEFYKVRVAKHRFAQKYKGDKKNKFGFTPSFILRQVSEIVDRQQERLGKVFRNEILPEYKSKGINLLRHNTISSAHKKAAMSYFNERIKGEFDLLEITNSQNIELINQAVYLYLVGKTKQWLLHLDYKKYGRFIVLSETSRTKYIIQLDDIFRCNIAQLVSEPCKAYAIKVSRDAELYIDEEQEGDIVKKIKKSIKKRETGLPARLLFDKEIRFQDINLLRKKTNIDMVGLIPGGRYHNFYDFFGFPKLSVQKSTGVVSKKLPCQRLEKANDWFDEIKKGDLLLSFPYQSYDYVVRFLEKACNDKSVTEIYITLYRVASDSKICQALELAAKSGKKVFVLDEVQARFDEESNIFWGERLEKAGAIVKYGVEGLKVHAKTFKIIRKEGNKKVAYSYLGTGNFNEKTANIYADHALITCNKKIATDLEKVFEFLIGERKLIKTKKLLVAPFSLRKVLLDKIQREVQLVKEGKSGHIQIKLNSLEDPEMIDAIRKAADQGVKVDLVIRGICCYIPLSKKQRENIKVVSVVDNYLEHTRIYHFNNDGKEETYLSSADWMTRNLSERIEVAFPIDIKAHQQLLIQQIKFQLEDNLKGRMIIEGNKYVKGKNKKSSQQKMINAVKKLDDQL